MFRMGEEGGMMNDCSCEVCVAGSVDNFEVSRETAGVVLVEDSCWLDSGVFFLPNPNKARFLPLVSFLSGVSEVATSEALGVEVPTLSLSAKSFAEDSEAGSARLMVG